MERLGDGVIPLDSASQTRQGVGDLWRIVGVGYRHFRYSAAREMKNLFNVTVLATLFAFFLSVFVLTPEAKLIGDFFSLFVLIVNLSDLFSKKSFWRDEKRFDWHRIVASLCLILCVILLISYPRLFSVF